MLKQLFLFDLKNFKPIKLNDKIVGWLNNDNLKISKNFQKSDSLIDIKHVVDYSLRSSSKIEQIEYCPIFDFNSLKPKIRFDHKQKFCRGKKFKINRKNLSLFGLPAYGVHCNIWSKYKNSTIIHLAKRSSKLEKFPGLYDNPVAGGQPVNLSIEQNLQKEAYEEAGLNLNQMFLAKKGSTIHYMHNEKKNFNSSVIFNYHLEKINNIEFKNQDGEVDEFISIEINKLYKILERKELKANCIIPIIDFLILKEGDFLSKKTMVEIKKIFNYEYNYE